MTERADIGVGDTVDVDEFLSTDVQDVQTNPLDSEEDEPEDNAINTNESSVGISNNDLESAPPVEVQVATPRPLVHRRTTVRERKEEPDELMALIKSQLLQDGMRREEEHQRREQERKDREEERRDERERRAEEARKSNEMMRMMMLVIFKGEVKENPESK